MSLLTLVIQLNNVVDAGTTESFAEVYGEVWRAGQKYLKLLTKTGTGDIIWRIPKDNAAYINKTSEVFKTSVWS